MSHPSNRPRVRLPLAENADEAKLRAWVQTVRTVNRVHDRMERALAPHGLSSAQFEVLAVLGGGDGITQQELAERLLVTKGNVCGLIDRIESQGYVARRPDLADRRVNRLHLTAAGRKVLARLMPGQVALFMKLLEPMSVADAKLLRRLLEDIEDAAVDSE